ncbi:MAG: hypothetical protein AAFO93_04320 [Pseudomonadota bacterium]
MPSRAEWALILAFAALALAGAVLGMYALRDLNALDSFTSRDTARGWLAMSGAMGACLSAMAMRDRFGRVGRGSLWHAAVAGVITTMLVGIVAGTLVLPIFGTMFGPWLVLIALLNMPVLAVPWMFALWGYDTARRSYTAERESLDAWGRRTHA